MLSSVYMVKGSNGFLKVCANNFTDSYQVVKNEGINTEWFKWGQLYSYCMQYDSATKNITSNFDADCSSTQCQNCLKVCNLQLPFELSGCEAKCTSNECKDGCRFYARIKEDDTNGNPNNLPATNFNGIKLYQKNVTSLNFKWEIVSSKSSPVLSSLYLVVLVVKTNKRHVNVLGLSASNEQIIVADHICSSVTGLYQKFRSKIYQLQVYPINYNGYDKKTFLNSSFTELMSGSEVQNLTIDPYPKFIQSSNNLLKNKLSWNITWNRPADLEKKQYKYGKFYAYLTKCSGGLYPEEGEKNVDTLPLQVSFDTTSQDSLQGCTLVVEIKTIIGSCITGDTVIGRVEYEGCHMIKKYGCHLMQTTTTTTPKPTDHPISNSEVQLTKSQEKCTSLIQTECGDDPCFKCNSAVFNVAAAWKKPVTFSPIQHYVVRWGTGFVNNNRFLIRKEFNKTNISPSATTYIIRNVPVGDLIVQVYAQTSTLGIRKSGGYSIIKLKLPEKKVFVVNQPDQYDTADGFLSLCSNNFVTMPKTNQISDGENGVKEDWFKWGRLYSFCMQYDFGSKNISTSMDSKCESIKCRQCMTACHISLPFDVAKCFNTCSSDECRQGCTFYNQTNNNNILATDGVVNASITPHYLSRYVNIVKKNKTSVTFEWPSISPKGSAKLSSVYLIVLESNNTYKPDLKNVLGLITRTIRTITLSNICSSYHQYGKFLDTMYSLRVYSINYNGYDRSVFLQSNMTKMIPFSAVRSLTINPAPRYIKSKSQLAQSRIAWNISWLPPQEVDLLGSVDVKVKVEVGIANCSNLENFQRLVQRGFISNEFETSVNNTQVTVSQANTDQDDLKSCLIEVKVSTLYGGCLLGDTAVQYVKYEGCETVPNYECPPLPTTPKPTDQPVTNITIKVLDKRCSRLTSTLCSNGFVNVTCSKCESMSYDIKMTWSRPFTASPLQHYVLRWGEGRKFSILVLMRREFGRKNIAAENTSYVLKDVNVETGGLFFAVQIHPKTNTSGDISDLKPGYTTLQLRGPPPPHVPSASKFTTEDGFLKICSNSFLKTKTNQVIRRLSDGSFNNQWLEWGRLYSYCMQYETATKNVSSILDVNCANQTCKSCMTACNVPHPFDLDACKGYCNSSECISGCDFYAKLKSPVQSLADSLQADKKKTQGSVFITERTTSTVSFSWSDIVSDSNPKLSSVYLLVLQVYNPIYPDLKNVLGLSTLSERNISSSNFCSSFGLYGKFNDKTKYKLRVYPINYLTSNRDHYIESNFTMMKRIDVIYNLAINPKPIAFKKNNDPVVPTTIRWTISWSVNSSSNVMLYKNFHKSFILLNCTIEENLKTMLTFFSENTVKTNTEIPSNVHHTTVDMPNNAYDSLSSCLIRVKIASLYNQCLRGDEEVSYVRYEGCNTVDNFDCAKISTTTVKPTNQPFRDEMINITHTKEECINTTRALCFNGKQNASCEICTTLAYHLLLQWQKPIIVEPIKRYLIRWGNASYVGSLKAPILNEKVEYNRVNVSAQETSYNITVTVKDYDIDLAVQVTPITNSNRKPVLVTFEGYTQILLKAAGNPISIQPPPPVIGEDDDNTEKIVLGVLVPLLLLALCFMVIMYFRHHQKRNSRHLHGMSFSKETLEMYLSKEDTELDDWEIFPINITLDEKIGEGAFGTVFSATLDAKVLLKSHYAKQNGSDLFPSRKVPTFAVKLLKEGASQMEYNDFKEEISLMKEIGFHRNIVNLIGCSTVNNPLCLVVEFMEHGDLLHYLRKRRTKLCTSQSSDSSRSYAYNQMFQSSDQDLNEKNEFVPNSTLSSDPDDPDKITADDLLSFAWQISAGMEYLAQKNLVHRDLAARNILVGSDRKVKVSDFGLTRAVSNDLIYMSNKNRKLPIKWMSVEAIFDQVFTTFSDVWAYGIVLFEIVTLGGTPYPSISNRELLGMLKSGYRMEKPENCADAMYDVMLHCWNEDPLQRPSFTELREHLESVLNEGDHYFSFDINQENTYYNVASFKSVPSDDEEENQVFDKEFMQKPIQIKTAKELKELQEGENDVNTKLQDDDTNVEKRNDTRYIELHSVKAPEKNSNTYVNSAFDTADLVL